MAAWAAGALLLWNRGSWRLYVGQLLGLPLESDESKEEVDEDKDDRVGQNDSDWRDNRQKDKCAGGRMYSLLFWAKT